MADKKVYFKSALWLVLIFVIAAALLTGANYFAAPLIAANGSAQQFESLYAVMPEAGDFEQLYTSADPAASTLAEVPETVQEIYAETSGLGYAVKLSTTQGYTGEAMKFTIAVDAEGKISGVELTDYPDSRDFGGEYPDTYLGQDSAMGAVSIVAGVTYSSAAFKNAVTDAFNALISNGLVGAGEKSDSQILTELASTAFPGLANSSGAPQYEAVELEGQTYLKTAMAALNGSGCAFIAMDGDASYLAICNVSGSCRVYDVEGNELGESEAAGIADEARQYTKANLSSFAEADMKKIVALAPEGAAAEELPLEGVFSTVSDAFTVTAGDAVYYGFAARGYGYSNLPLTVYVLVDADGAIVSMDADELIFYPEYFSSYELDEGSYKAGFTGLTGDSFTGEQALIAGATASSNAVSSAVADILAAFAALNLNGGAD